MPARVARNVDRQSKVGTRSRDEIETDEVVSVEPPDWLIGPEAVKEWERVLPLLMKARIMTEPDIAAFGTVCNLHADRIQTYRAGSKPKASETHEMRLLWSDLGMTPAGRLRMSPKKAEGDEPDESVGESGFGAI